MADKPLKVRVCKECGWEPTKKARKKLKKEYGDTIKIKKVDCLDLCEFEPAARVGKTAVAPATRKGLRVEINRRLDTESD